MAAGGGAAVVVGTSTLHQQGLFAAKAFKEGEVILHEVPLVALQSLENRQDVPVCANCMAFVGSARQHLQLLAGKVDRQGLAEPDLEETKLQGAIFSPLVPCSMGCGELYCSVSCGEEHWARGHRLLCVGPVGEEEAETHPLVRFKVHAVSTNEIFLLVGDLISRVITTYEANGGNLQAALQPFKEFVHLPWWEVAINPDPQADPHQFQELLKSLCVESSTLLRQALLRPGLESLFEPIFFGCVIGMFEQNNVGIRNRSALFRVMDAVRVSVGAEPHLASYVAKAYLPCIKSIIKDRDENDGDDDEEEEEEEGGGGGHHHHHGNCHHDHREDEEEEEAMMAVEEDEEDEEVGLAEAGLLLEACREEKGGALFPPLDGTALYALICKMNHSCQPNCRVYYVGGLQQQQPMQAQLVALTHVAPSEELFQSYIDETQPYAERQRALADYGFTCACTRCRTEEQAGGKATA